MGNIDKVKEKLKKTNVKIENTIYGMINELKDMSEDIKKGILKIFNKEKHKALPMPKIEQNNNEIITGKEKRKQMQEELRKNIPLIQSNTLDYAIDQYLKSLYIMYKETGMLKSYKALTTLSSNEDKEDKGNKLKEEKFISKIKNNNKYRLIEQQSKALGAPCFYHIKTQNYSFKDEKNAARLYINLKRENVTDFSEKFIEELGEQEFYFKFDSDKQMEVDKRSEKVVVYCKTSDLAEKVEAIRKVQLKYPKLLEGSKNTNPFLDTIDGYISYAPDPKTGYFIKRDGETEKAQSFNTLLSKALLESFTYASNNLVKRHPEITNGKTYNDATAYIALYPQMEKYNNELIEYVKKEVEKEKTRNPDLQYIKGEKNNRGSEDISIEK